MFELVFCKNLMGPWRWASVEGCVQSFPDTLLASASDTGFHYTYLARRAQAQKGSCLVCLLSPSWNPSFYPWTRVLEVKAIGARVHADGQKRFTRDGCPPFTHSVHNAPWAQACGEPTAWTFRETRREYKGSLRWWWWSWDTAQGGYAFCSNQQFLWPEEKGSGILRNTDNHGN